MDWWPGGIGQVDGPPLAWRSGLRWYSCDTRTWVHRDRTVAAGHQGVIAWAALTVAERQEAQDQGRRGDYSRYDRRPMVVDDLLRVPKQPLVVAEGGLARPAVSGVGANALWLVPPEHVWRSDCRNSFRCYVPDRVRAIRAPGPGSQP